MSMIVTGEDVKYDYGGSATSDKVDDYVKVETCDDDDHNGDGDSATGDGTMGYDDNNDGDRRR